MFGGFKLKKTQLEEGKSYDKKQAFVSGTPPFTSIGSPAIGHPVLIYLPNPVIL
jgi:hypothetical protein